MRENEGGVSEEGEHRKKVRDRERSTYWEVIWTTSLRRPDLHRSSKKLTLICCSFCSFKLHSFTVQSNDDVKNKWEKSYTWKKLQVNTNNC